MRLCVRVAGCLALLADAGCSFLTVRGVRPAHPSDPPHCTGEVVAPVFDTVLAGAGAATAVAAAVGLSEPGCRAAPCTAAVVLVPAVITAVVMGQLGGLRLRPDPPVPVPRGAARGL